MKFIVEKEADLAEVSQKLLALFEENKVFAFKAGMGMGKTTLISYLAKAMGIEESISSPTFGYVNEYESNKYGTVYHFDLYRIEDEEEAYDIGIEEYIYGEEIVFIEWAENIANLLPEDCVWIHITKDDNEARFIEVKYEN